MSPYNHHRPSTAFWSLLGLLACVPDAPSKAPLRPADSGGADDGGADSGGSDGGGVDTADTSPPAVEDCANGADDDSDGLIDCEDADCADQPACRESCGNGADDDGDGLVDCGDPDCAAEVDCSWAGRARSHVLGGSVSGRIRRDGYWHTSFQRLTATGVWGTVTVLPVGYTSSWSADAAVVCTWTVDSLSTRNRWRSTGFFREVETLREGMTLSDDCPMPSSAGFLPDTLVADGFAAWVARPDSAVPDGWNAGEQWYRPGDLRVRSHYSYDTTHPATSDFWVSVSWEGNLASSGAVWSWEPPAH